MALFALFYALGMLTLPLAGVIHQNAVYAKMIRTDPAYAAARQIEQTYPGVYVMSMRLTEKTTGAEMWFLFDGNRVPEMDKMGRVAYFNNVYWSAFSALRETFPDAEYYKIVNCYLTQTDTIRGEGWTVRAWWSLLVTPTGADRILAADKIDTTEQINELLQSGMAWLQNLLWYNVTLDYESTLIRPVGFLYPWES